MENNFIPKGMDMIKLAVEHDDKEDLEKALSYYKQGLSYFMTGVFVCLSVCLVRPVSSNTGCLLLSLISGLKYVKNDKAKEAIREKVNQYMERAEQIKTVLDKNKGKTTQTKEVLTANGSSSSSSSKGKDSSSKEKEEKKEDEEEEKDTDALKLQAAISSAIIQEKPNVKWDDVAGLETAKACMPALSLFLSFFLFLFLFLSFLLSSSSMSHVNFVFLLLFVFFSST
jgi:vacuolar protein-sorting-associated protein 4